MAFTGTLDKCKACDKTVYVMDLMTLEGMPYHKSCFRCSHCNGTLVVSIFFFLCSSSSIIPLFLWKNKKRIFLLLCRLATTHPWMEFCIASLILNNSSKNLEISARIFRQVKIFCFCSVLLTSVGKANNLGYFLLIIYSRKDREIE